MLSAIGWRFWARRFERLKSPLKVILSWYERANGRCRHEIFGDIFWLAFGICGVRPHDDFPAHDEAFCSGIEHAGTGISGGRWEILFAHQTHNMGCGDDQALSQISAVVGPRLRRVLDDIERVDAQGIVGRLSMREAERQQGRRYQAEPYPKK
jgi:hypothetical protein